MELITLLDQFITEYGSAIFYTISAVVIGIVSSRTKNTLKEYIEKKTKKSIDMTVVKTVEEIYYDKNINNKNKTLKTLKTILGEERVTTTKKELITLLENTLEELKHNSID